MSISSENRKAGPYTGNGIAASFTFSFKVFSASDVVVTRQVIATGAETTLVLLTDYTVTLNGNQELNPGGSVVLPAALASTFKLTITSGVANLQPTTLTNAGGFYPTVINDSLDRATILTQQLRERLLRSISYPVSDPTNVATTLPAAAQRASKVLSFDVNGAPETSFSALDVQNAQSNAAAASASAAAALASENAAAASALSASGSASSASSSATAAASSATAAQNAVSQIQWNDVVFINSNLTVDSTYRGKLIAVDTSSGNVTVSLPAISSLDLTTPFVIGIKKSDASGNVVNIAPNGADLINNQASKTVSVLDAGTTLIPDMDPAPDQWSALDFGAISGNMVKDTFSGNGSQTVFTLTTVPASKNNTQVFISGVYQAKSNYNLVGSTVTFLLAPPSGTNNIEVISGTTLSIGVPSDGVVSNTKLANMSSQTIKGRTSAGVGSPEDLTAAQATAILNPFTGDSGAGGVKGLVPAPASGDAAQSKFLKADGTWAVSGLGGGSKNYYATSNANPNFSSGSVSPFSACSLTLSSGVPSGAPSLTATQMAISANSTNPLLASQSAFNLRLAKSGAAQGQGFISGVLTIDREDLAKVLTGSFSYEVVTGTVDFSGSATQDLEIWIYNVNAGQWIQPAGYRGINQSSGQGVVTFTFQSDSTAANNQYRIAVITAQTSGSTYTVAFNDFKIGPAAIVGGATVSDWQSYTPTLTGFGTATNIEFQYRRVGSDLEIRGKYTSGTSTAVEARISFPSGLTSADTSRIPSIQLCGQMQSGDVNASTTAGIGSSVSVLIEPSVTYFTFSTRTSTLQGLTKVNASSIAASGVAYSFFAKVPIQGWSSNVQLSSDTDTRVVAFAATKTATQSIPNNSYTVIDFNNVEINTHGSTYAAGAYTAPISGYYRVSFNFNFSTGSGGTIFAVVNKNGAQFSRLSTQPFSTSQSGGSGSTILYLNAGENVSISVIQLTGAAQTLEQAGRFSVERLSGPSVVAASETVALRYTNTAGSSYGGSATLMPFATKDYDTHNAWVTNTFTAPISGKYLVNCIFTSASTGIILDSQVYKNGSFFCQLGYGYSTGSTRAIGTATVSLNAGETISIYASSNVAGSLSTVAGLNHLSITRVGN